MSEPDLDDDLSAYVRFHGANEVMDALLAVAVDLNESVEDAVAQVHRLMLLRGARFLNEATS